jgi:hypothetical protein
MATFVSGSCAFEPARILERKVQMEITFCGRIEAGYQALAESSAGKTNHHTFLEHKSLMKLNIGKRKT